MSNIFNNFHKKHGFTLIELLVVIGILAVLAAIAIPSVAGLIDRANVSADATNANEMTNAMERFASEYELYRQDISSGRIDFNDLDSAQSRVYNSVGATKLKEIELLESAGFNGKQIDRDTKYPKNPDTATSIIQNYVKTESSTFIPKQSDCHYYFSPQIGIVVCSEISNSSTAELNALIKSGKDAKGNILDENIEWIDISIENNIGINHNANVVSKGATYKSTNGTIYTEGMELPTLERGDRYTFGDYTYVYKVSGFGPELDGWSVSLVSGNRKKETYASPLAYIRNEPVVKARQLFLDVTSLKYAPKMPETMIDMTQTFCGCTSLVYSPDIPDNVVYLSQAFHDCTSLRTSPKISANVEDLFIAFGNSGITRLPDLTHCTKLTSLASAFYNCHNLVDISNFIVPQNVVSLNSMFSGSENIEKSFIIPEQVTNISYMYKNCPKLKGTLFINASNVEHYTDAIKYTQIINIEGNCPENIKNAILNTK